MAPYRDRNACMLLYEVMHICCNYWNHKKCKKIALHFSRTHLQNQTTYMRAREKHIGIGSLVIICEYENGKKTQLESVDQRPKL